MASPINKKTLEYLADLARIELDPEEEAKLLTDLERILEYVSELQSLDTEGVAPSTGGTSLRNAFREDRERSRTHEGEGKDAFPDSQNGFLKVPPVFGS